MHTHHGLAGFSPRDFLEGAPSSEEIFSTLGSPSYLENFERFLSTTLPAMGYEIVIVDCHGGVDPVSYGAFAYADETLMVTEADSVTFAGTLELLDFYGERWLREHGVAAGSGDDESQTNRNPIKNIKFIVNRLPAKYKFRDPEKLYAPLLSAELGKSISISDEHRCRYDLCELGIGTHSHLDSPGRRRNLSPIPGC